MTPAQPDLRSWLGPGEAAVLGEGDLADLAVAVEAALAGGREVMRRYRSEPPAEVEEKGPGDPVTEADREADRAIRRVLERRRPGEAIRSEEGPSADDGSLDRGHLWIADPLDGTKEFLARNGEFAVMVGLAVAGRARLGVVYRPDPGVLYLGCSAGGAWRAALEEDGAGEGEAGPRAADEVPVGETDPDDSAGAEPPESAEGARGLEAFGAPLPLTVEGLAPPGVRLIHSRSHTPEGLDRLAEALGDVTPVPLGSAGLKAAAVAEGRAEIYVHPVPYMQEWDTCAPEAVARGAGSRFTDCRGEPLAYGKPDPAQSGGVFVARPDVWERAREVAAELAP